MQGRLEATIRGRVQMVMYRDFTNRKARALGLAGEVKNLSDGTVLVIAEGSRDKLKQLLSLLKKGSLFSRVAEVGEVWGEMRGGYSDFRISYE